MPTVAEALKTILATKLRIPAEELPLQEAVGRVLAEDIFADRDFPPFDRVAMDGIAIHFSSNNERSTSFKVEDLRQAGTPQGKLNDLSGCIEVMTGAILPENTDTVIRYEDIEILEVEEKKLASLRDISPQKGQNVHKKGSDRKTGELLIPAGMLVSPAEVAVAATVGKSRVLVTGLPRIALISTGNELVDVDKEPLPYQIRKSNMYSLQAALLEEGIESEIFHIEDEKEKIYNALKHILDEFEVLILSGGVSMGKADFIPEVLKELQVSQLFHKVDQRPGKPFWFGKKEDRNIVFAFPGNPVSTFLCFYKYFIPWFSHATGKKALSLTGILDEDFDFQPSLTYFLQVKISFTSNGFLCKPTSGKGSGDLANLINSDGFLELPKEESDFKAGQSFPLILYRKLL